VAPDGRKFIGTMKKCCDAVPVTNRIVWLAGHVGERAQSLLGVVEDRGELRAAVAVLEDADARPRQVPQRRLRLAQHRLGQGRGPRGEVDGACAGPDGRHGGAGCRSAGARAPTRSPPTCRA
jgi:hypothetical protein